MKTTQKNEKSFCSRTVLFVIIFVLALIVVGGAVAIGVYFGIKNTSDKNTNNTQLLPPQGECGIQTYKPSGTENASSINTSLRIINGDDSVKNSWPWMISIRLLDSSVNGFINYSNHFCSGSLVYRDFILTTAHCFNAKNYTGKDFIVVVGKSSLNETIDQTDIYLVSDLIIHPQYNTTTVQNDIAFLKLVKKVDLNDKVKLICLPSSSSLTDLVYNKLIMGLGWGRISAGQNDPQAYSNDLKQTTLKVLNLNDSLCETHPRYDSSLMYCVLGVRNGSNFCWGDSGGPMSVNLNGKWTVFGNTNTLVVTSDGSCDPLKPAYYTKLPLYLDWMATFIK